MFNDLRSRDERMGYGTPDDTSTPWVLVVVLLIILFLGLGLAGHADLVARGFMN